ncbi:MAG TPA: hypothetical protein VN840_12910 [Streptosporangiaceae bacterium]|nr:hypothetical protein [Streptosporangiaceae bacterium]
MRLHSNASGRRGRLVLGMTMAAGLVLTLAACSASSTTAPPTGTAQPTSAAAPATTPATSAPAAAATGLSGKWLGQYSGAYQGTFNLRWHQSGSNLSGTIKLSAPRTTLPIHGTVKGNVIRFGTVGSLGITYSGTVSGNSMSGTYQVHAASGPVGGPWSATKT